MELQPNVIVASADCILKTSFAPRKSIIKILQARIQGTPQDVIVRYKNANIFISPGNNVKSLLIKPSSVLLIPAHRHKNHAHENYLKIEHNFAHYPHSIEKSRKGERKKKGKKEKACKI